MKTNIKPTTKLFVLIDEVLDKTIKASVFSIEENEIVRHNRSISDAGIFPIDACGKLIVEIDAMKCSADFSFLIVDQIKAALYPHTDYRTMNQYSSIY